jgi:hypothetical protein
MRACLTCAHFRTIGQKCTHDRCASAVTGQVEPRDAVHMRAEDGPCGPEGRLWVGHGVVTPPHLSAREFPA